MRLRYADIATSGTDADSLFPLMSSLRPQLKPAQFRVFTAEARGTGYNLTAAYDQRGCCVAVAGYRIVATSRGRIMFLDDLVTRKDVRSCGIGARVFAELEKRANLSGCDRIELDSGTTNQRAHQFYARQGMAAAALHFTKELTPGFADARGTLEA